MIPLCGRALRSAGSFFVLRLSGNWIYAEDRLQKGMFALSASCKSIYEDEKQGITRWHIENVEAERKLSGC